MKRSVSTLFLVSSLAFAQFQTAGPEWQQAQQQYPPRATQANYPVDASDVQPSDVPEAPDPNDLQHGVARLSIAQGDVSVRRGDNGELTGAVANAPLLSRDRVQTAQGSRAEIQFDSANLVRLGPDTDLGLASATFGRYQMQIGIGTVVVRVLRDSQTQLELDTPSVAFRPLGQGDFRISVFDNGTTQLTVRAGRIEMAGPRGSQTVNAGESLLVRGDSSDPEFQNAYPPQPDQLDDWSAGRDSELTAARSYQYVSPEVTGAEDLDRYGNWVPSQYGQVWTPRVESADWSPYSNGQWSYEDYYGWTWIGYEPWGWAPYHYGRWFWNTGYGWCWWPGARFGGRIGWSPALVSFFGFGGGLGWVSLAPYERYHPWWGRGGYGFNSYRYDVGRYYRNAGIRGGALTAGFGAFSGAGHRYNIASRGQLSGGELWHGRLPVSPNPASFRYSDRPAFSNQRLSHAASRQFFNRPQTFSRQMTQPYSAPRPPFNSANGWQRFGSPGNAPSAPRQPQSFVQRGNESGWHNFGQPSAPRYNYSAPTQRYTPQPQQRYYSAPAPRYNYSAPAPRYSAPARSAPAAPSYHGGGGGGSHSGGGGGHVSGGGGGHRGR